MYKKIVAAVVFLFALQGLAFAASLPADVSFTPSHNVSISYTNDGGTTPQDYVVNTKHQAGDKAYATSNNTSNIWSKNATKGDDVTSYADTTAGDSQFDGWTSQ